MSSAEPPGAPFWEDLLAVASGAFGVWTDRGPALAWAERAWRVLAEEKLVPDDRAGTPRDAAIALVTLLALASVYRDFCKAAFDEPSYIDDLVYAAENSAVPDVAIARFAGEHEQDIVSCEDEYDSMFDMLPGLIAWRRPAVVAVLMTRLGPDQMMRELWLTCLGSDVFEDTDGEPLDEAQREAILSEPWTVGDGSPMPAYGWLSDGCPPLGD
jgi:hypothetical protein